MAARLEHALFRDSSRMYKGPCDGFAGARAARCRCGVPDHCASLTVDNGAVTDDRPLPPGRGVHREEHGRHVAVRDSRRRRVPARKVALPRKEVRDPALGVVGVVKVCADHVPLFDPKRVERERAKERSSTVAGAASERPKHGRGVGGGHVQLVPRAPSEGHPHHCRRDSQPGKVVALGGVEERDVGHPMVESLKQRRRIGPGDVQHFDVIRPVHNLHAPQPEPPRPRPEPLGVMRRVVPRADHIERRVGPPTHRVL
mmetsp:Transcript_21501/g.56044  ORF Transcript_21501/g.56044 Transcript_21501/m.56044 type:complete len:257 (-) Transcript_21501:1617-2387(-)